MDIRAASIHMYWPSSSLSVGVMASMYAEYIDGGRAERSSSKPSSCLTMSEKSLFPMQIISWHLAMSRTSSSETIMRWASDRLGLAEIAAVSTPLRIMTRLRISMSSRS